MRNKKLAYGGSNLSNLFRWKKESAKTNKGSRLSLVGLQVFGHGVEFVFTGGRGVSLFLFGRLAKPWISGLASPLPNLLHPKALLTSHPPGSNSGK